MNTISVIIDGKEVLFDKIVLSMDKKTILKIYPEKEANAILDYIKNNKEEVK